jgi:cellulase (glycosyl hydrolase family 5)
MLPSNKLVGVNFHGYGSSVYQNRDTPLPPENYIDDSFAAFSKYGITCVRVTIHWESWEFDQDQFEEDIRAIGDAADMYGIMCIYDNHQWECSSWIGSGIGFPNSLMSNLYPKAERPRSIPNHKTKKDFWDRWWDRNLITISGLDGWDAQVSFLLKIVKLLDSRRSTFGFELLNEPAVFSLSHYHKIRSYNDYLIDNLRRITAKPIFFCWAPPHGLIDTPILQAMASPTNKENIIFDCHPYPPSYAYLLYFKLTSKLIGRNVPLYIGEFNSGIRPGFTLGEKQIASYTKRLAVVETCGWALWRWSYIKDQNIPAFNLTNVSNGRIEPNDTFRNIMTLQKNSSTK